MSTYISRDEIEKTIAGYNQPGRIPYNPNGARYSNIDHVVDAVTIKGAFAGTNFLKQEK